jgi:hypothetical protein
MIMVLAGLAMHAMLGLKICFGLFIMGISFGCS